MSSRTALYDILEVSKNASQSDIKLSIFQIFQNVIPVQNTAFQFLSFGKCFRSYRNLHDLCSMDTVLKIRIFLIFGQPIFKCLGSQPSSNPTGFHSLYIQQNNNVR